MIPALRTPRPPAEARRPGTARPPGSPSPHGPGGWRRRLAAVDRRLLALHGGVIALFTVLAVLMWWRVWITGDPTSSITCQCGDVSEALGFLAWPPWALLHGHNPFYRAAIYAGQGGANMLTNASWLSGGVVLSPVTVLFGPIVSFNVAVTLAPVVTGWAFFVAVRRITTFVPGQVIAAALYGFSPVVVTSDPFGHFFQIFLFYPPLVFVCLHDLFVTRRHRPARVGVALGLLTVVQFFTGTEVLVITLVMAGIGAVIAAVLAPRAAWARRGPILVGLGAAVVVAVPLLAYPVWFALGGPAHIVGPAWPGTVLSGLAPLSFLQPGSYVHHVSSLSRTAGYYGPLGPDPGFVGAGVLVFIGVSVVAWYRRRTAWFLVLLAAAAWSLSLGSVLLPVRAATDHDWLPWRFFAHLPVVSQVIPGRFSASAIFAVALLVGLSADSWWRLLSAPRGHHHARRRRITPAAWVGAVVVSGAAVAALVPLAATYTFPFVLRDSPVPPWFRIVAPRLAPSTVVLAYPYPNGGRNQAMGWQAENAMHYRIVGGFAIVPGANGKQSAALSPFGGTRLVLADLSNAKNTPIPLVGLPVVSEVRTSLAQWKTQVVVVTDQGRNPAYAAGFFTAVLGRPPRIEHDAWVWYGLGRAPPLHLAPFAVASCTDRFPDAVGPGVPGCVMASASHPA